MLKGAHRLACRRRFCRAAVVPVLALMLVIVTVQRLTTQRRQASFTVPSTEIPRASSAFLNVTVAPPGGQTDTTSTFTGSATRRRDGDRVTCERWTPSDDTDKKAKKIFFSKPKANCSHQRRHEICRIEVC